ncbi:MAG: hypothetical protein M3347_04580 [Armatimonadota bacterium]|nr:hypothetical protein [Armatimonadota bacterium]
MAITIEFSAEVESQLEAAAASQGQDATTFARVAVEEKLQSVTKIAEENGTQTLDQALAGLIGVVNIPSDLSERAEEVFGEIITEKFRKQGLDV